MATYKIIPLALSKPFLIEPAALYYKAYKGELMGMIYGCFALKNNETGEVIMVDTGLASQEDIAKYDYPFRRMEGAPNLKDVLADKGIDPSQVKTIIFTHPHQDHCFNLELFPNASMYVQKVELQHAATPTKVEAKSYQKYDRPGLPAWARAFGRLITIEGDRKLMDGIEILFTPGHTPGSQTVVVDTEKGKYLLVGDNFYTMEQFTECRMNGNFTDLEGWYTSRDKVIRYMEEHGGQILCVHNPDIYSEEYYG